RVRIRVVGTVGPGDGHRGVGLVDRDRLGSRGGLVVPIAGEVRAHGVGAGIGGSTRKRRTGRIRTGVVREAGRAQILRRRADATHRTRSRVRIRVVGTVVPGDG